MHRFLNTTTRNVAWFKKALNAEELEVRPPFQRNPVWTDRQKSYLIDSILHEYPIPELYMQELVDHEGKEKYIIVDGQQRVRACLEFTESKFSMNGEDSPQWADMTFEELSIPEKRKIFEYNFVVRQLPEMPEEELRAIFQRLNKNVVVLNKQELRHATYWGPFLKAMEGLAELEFWGESGIFSANDFRRMLDVEYVSEITISMLHGPQNKKQSLDKWYELYEVGFDQQSEVKNTFLTVIGELTQILSNLPKTRWKKKSDFYTLFTVFASHKDTLPLSSEKREQARSLILKFGADVTEFLKDVTQTEGFSNEIIEYSKNVERSASDLANRKRRFENLDKALAGVWPTVSVENENINEVEGTA